MVFSGYVMFVSGSERDDVALALLARAKGFKCSSRTAKAVCANIFSDVKPV